MKVEYLKAKIFLKVNSLLECYFISINELTLKKKKLNNNFVDGNTIFRIS